MERFSISILCQQVYNICRLCGVDNPDKIPIIGAEEQIFIADTEEPSLVKKIEQCVGIKVDLMDQMPQQICSLCVDKVNDFFEYRSMCESINIQTRRFLSLPLVQSPISTPKPIKVENAVIALDDDDDVDTKPLNKRGPKTRNRKKQPDTEQPSKGEEPDSKPVVEGPSEKRIKYDYPCEYCNESYSQSTELDRHLVVKHTPLVHKFGCGSCMEYFDTATEYKDHNLWHKLTRTAFGCFRCSRKFAKINTLNKHVAMAACIRQPRVSYEVTLVPDMQCSLCHKVFKTRNLYEWHGCFMRTRANCPKCGKYFLKKNLLIRHYMLYCTGTNPLLEPIVIPKDEPGSGPVNEAPRGGTTDGRVAGRKRGRPRTNASIKDETIDLPFPPLLDLPDLKSESNSIPDGHASSECTLSGTEMEDNPKRASLIEETNKITTLLRSGESVDGNTDINTINSMLSSVNEAIATISKVRKKKKKKDRFSSSGPSKQGEVAEQSNQPMVVLSMANVKQEVHGDSDTVASNSASGMENGFSEVEPANAGNAANAGDSDSDVEIISVEQYQPNNSGTIPAANWNDTTVQNNAQSHETEAIEQTIPIKQEPLAIGEEDESDFEGYEDASMFVAVKQEPLEETVESVTFEQYSTTAEKQSEPSLSSYQALRIKIKKEKGLLNASVVSEEDPTDPISTPEDNSDASKTSRVKKTLKTKRSNNPPPVKRCLRASTMSMNVSIKQEPLEAEEQPQERMTEPAQDYPPEDNEFFDATIRIKQEPQEKETNASTEDVESMQPSDEIAFDGRRIKRERADDELTSCKKHTSSNDSARKAFNPLSLTGVRIAGGKKSVTSQPSVSAHNSSVVINPFALRKQKESVPTVAEQDSGSKDSECSTARSERFGLPVISQVKSIDPVEHLSLTHEDTVAAESAKEASKQQKETTEELDSTVNVRHTESAPSQEPCSSEAGSVATSNVPPQENGSGLMIASVTTISEEREPPLGNSNELKIASVTTIPEERISLQENISETNISSVTTMPEEREPPQGNSSELNIATVTMISEAGGSPQTNNSEINISPVATIPEKRESPQKNSKQLKNASVSTIPEDMVQGCPSQEPHNEQSKSADDGDKVATQENLTQQQQVANDIEPVAKLDSSEDEESRAVDDIESALQNEKEKLVVSSAFESSERLLEDTAEASKKEEPQMSNNHDTVVAETSDNIDAVTESAHSVITTEDEKANSSGLSSEDPEECSVGEIHANTLCAVAKNDAVLVAKQ